MRHFITLIACVICVGLVNLPAAAEKKTPPEVDMSKKLEYSKNILDGLVREDFDRILASAKSLNKLAERKWLENESAEYRTQNQVFWFLTGTLTMAAEQKNIDGATLSYLQITQSCINCHKLIRRR